MSKRKEKGGGTKKYDRNRKWCQAYRLRGQREINKARRLLRHLKRYPQDSNTLKVFDALPAPAKRAAKRA